jgi:hypothetical protein
LGLNKNPGNSSSSDYLVRAAELGSIDAVNILHKTQAKLIPKRNKNNSTY